MPNKITISKVSYYIIIIIIFSIAFSPSIRFGRLGLNLHDIIVPIYGFFLIFNRKHILKSDFQVIKYFSYYLFFLLFATLYGFIAFKIDPRINDAFEFIHLVKYVLIIIIVQSSNEENFIVKFERWMSISAIVLIIISFIEYYNIFDLKLNLYHIFNVNINKYNISSEHRNVGSSGNPNEFSSVLVIFTFFFLNKFINNVKKGGGAFILLIFLIMSVLMTASRTGFIALVTGTLYVLFAKNNISFIAKFTALAFVILIIVYFSVSNIAYFTDSVTSFFLGENTSMNARYMIWDNITNHIKTSPLVGYGTAKDFFVAKRLLTDNEYLMIFLKSGLIGFVIYFIYYLKSFVLIKNKIFTNENQYFKHYIYSIYIISLIYMYTSSWYFSYKSFVLFIVLYAISIKYYTKKVNIKNNLAS